ncbi:hypothetical protein SPRG_13736 [Saprolegnia parasitica CBS 223.65]|uniref:Nuclear pore complex protein n=1 Tax=Saprolegnia parasitica (strain CBS 223.65) TaxID=695850 RepID=A0A067C376_SAPPC|nr:hypothetical protein SPRG_13736 [Saprolegnia parasitica CBS 223.65]KDO21237.1 hypothetical protein SPRG_13736 [Saprolegnia parasitica CBS 223.65]|eukprot:XP_012208069.1 hypothetical protein SPRG_13736 [Saprolegnia parasitica CBS 223.65]
MAQRTSELILAAESSLAFLAQLQEEEEHHEASTIKDVDMTSYEPVATRPEVSRAAKAAALLDVLEAASVEKSVKQGMAHVKVQFPDRSVEYVDVDAATTTVGHVLYLAWAKRQSTPKPSDAPRFVGLFQGQEVPSDWVLLDCGLALEGTLHLQLASSSRSATANMRPYDHATISSISNAYETQSDDSNTYNNPTMHRAAWIEHSVRPEEDAFATALDQLYTKLEMVEDPNQLCQQVLSQYVEILQNEIEARVKAGVSSSSSSSSAPAPFSLQHGFSFQNKQPDPSVLLNELKNERNTWRLLYELRDLSIQKHDDLCVLQTSSQLPLTAASTELDAIAALENRNQLYALQKTVLKWLEAVAAENVVATTEKRHMHARTLKQLQRQRRASVVCAMDPDGPLREGDSYVDDDDAEDELDLLTSVWHLLRAGKPREAADLCIQLGQPWRAASLAGGEVNGACEGDDGVTRWGNPYRILWKHMCWQLADATDHASMAKTTSLRARELERVIYAALSGNATVVLSSPTCASWEDHVWALTKAAVGHAEDDAISHLLELKAQSTTLALELNKDHLRLYRSFLATTKAVGGQYVSSMESLFADVSGSANATVRDQASHPHRRIQAKLVSSRVDVIIRDILARLVDTDDKMLFSWDLGPSTHDVSPQLLRFGAHFVLFMKTTGEVFDVDAGHKVLKAYLRHLVQHKQFKLVALYASQLPEDARAAVYAQCVTAVPSHACLAAIAPFCSPPLFAHVTKTAAEAMMTMPHASDADRIGALDILCYDESHRAEAVVQANSLARYFVLQDKQSSLTPLLAALPPDTLALLHRVDFGDRADDLRRAVREHLAWKAYVEATEAYDAWRSLVGSRRAVSCFSEEEAEVKTLLFRASVALAALIDVLHFEHGWLLHCGVANADVLRARCLPSLVFFAHRVQMETLAQVERLQFYPAAAIPTMTLALARDALQLADVVADEHYRVYTAFSMDETRHLLALLQQSALAHLACAP